MDSNLQRKLATKAGKIPHPNYVNTTWIDEYDHHLGSVDEPLLFEKFRTKFNILNSLLDADPEGKNPSLDSRIDKLCLEIGC